MIPPAPPALPLHTPDAAPYANALDRARCKSLILWLLLICVPLFFFQLGGWGFFDPDEGRYAEVRARNVGQSRLGDADARLRQVFRQTAVALLGHGGELLDFRSARMGRAFDSDVGGPDRIGDDVAAGPPNVRRARRNFGRAYLGGPR